MIIDQALLDQLSAQARTNPRLRQSYDLRNPSTSSGQAQSNDNSQRMLNALEPGTVMPVHRHRETSESIAVVRGKLVMRMYDDGGRVTEECVLQPGGANVMVQVEAGRWHSLEVLEAGTVVFEAKDGKYQPLGEEDVMGKVTGETEVIG